MSSSIAELIAAYSPPIPAPVEKARQEEVLLMQVEMVLGFLTAYPVKHLGSSDEASRRPCSTMTKESTLLSGRRGRAGEG